MKFTRQERYKTKLAGKWRRPKGLHSKMRLGKRGHAGKPSQGYRAAVSERGRIAGLEPVRVERPEDLQGLDPKTHAIIVGSVGTRKRIAIIEAAKGFTITNGSEKTAEALKRQYAERTQLHAKRKEEREKRHKELEEKVKEAEKEAAASEETEASGTPAKKAAKKAASEKASEPSDAPAKETSSPAKKAAETEKPAKPPAKKAAEKTAVKAEEPAEEKQPDEQKDASRGEEK